MHRVSRLLIGTLILLMAPSVATASVLNLDPSSLSITIGTLPPVVIPNNPSSITVSSGAGTFTEPFGVFGPTTVGLPGSLFTGVSLVSGLTLAGFGNGTKFCTQTGPIRCSGGLAGTALVNVLQLFNLSVPLSVAGSPGASVAVSAGGILITVTGQGWIAGTATVTFTSVTPSGATVINSAFSVGSDNRTAGHGGNLVLVSGFRAITNVAGTLPGFAVQRLNFAPEPVGLLLLGIGLGGFGLYAGLRRRRR